MKRKLVIAFLCLMMFCMQPNLFVFAEAESIKIYLDGSLVEPPTEPIIENGTTLVPMRIIFEKLGMTVSWDGATETVTGTGSGVTVKITVGSDTAYINNSEKKISVPAKIINGSTMVPLRFVSEAAGCTVHWEDATQKITISTGKEKPVAYENDIIMGSTEKKASSSALYVVDGTGEFEGYKRLRGYPNEDEFEVYYQGNESSYVVKIKELKEEDLNEIITWQYNGASYQNKRKDLYALFSDTSWFRTHLGISNDTLSFDWFDKTFGNTFSDWLQGYAYSNDAAMLVDRYFRKINPPKNNVTLMPGTGVSKGSPVIISEEPSEFIARDKEGNVIGEYHDSQDMELMKALTEKRKDLPPRLSSGWINTDFLSKIYEFDIVQENDTLIFKTVAPKSKQKELLRLELPAEWLPDANGEVKVNGVGVKKYPVGSEGINGKWIDEKDLKEETGVQFVFGGGDSIYEAVFCGPYEGMFKEVKRLLTVKFPEDWGNSDNREERVLNGLRVKREDSIDYFYVEDLVKLKVIQKPKTHIIYLNIKDLRKVGLIG